jgi:hypothetical protein
MLLFVWQFSIQILSFLNYHLYFVQIFQKSSQFEAFRAICVALRAPLQSCCEDQSFILLTRSALIDIGSFSQNMYLT